MGRAALETGLYDSLSFPLFSATKLQFVDFHEIERGLRIMHGMEWDGSE
jgi:hypothetical protein